MRRYDKPELFRLVHALHAKGVDSAGRISELLGVSERYIRNVMGELGLPTPSRLTFEEAMRRTDAELLREVLQFRKRGKSPTRRRRAA